MTEVLSVENHLRKLFPELDSLEVKNLEKVGISVIHRKGDVIAKQEEPCNGLLLLVNGKLSIKLESKNTENIMHFLMPGETFYAHESFLNTPNKTSCICLETSLLFTIPNTELKKLLSKRPELMLNMMQLSTRESELFEQRAASLITLPIKHRFIDSLLVLIRKFGVEKPDHLYVPIKREEIGSYINASKASLSRVVTALEKSKVISTSRQGIKVLNKEALLDNI